MGPVEVNVLAGPRPLRRATIDSVRATSFGLPSAQLPTVCLHRLFWPVLAEQTV